MACAPHAAHVASPDPLRGKIHLFGLPVNMAAAGLHVDMRVAEAASPRARHRLI